MNDLDYEILESRLMDEAVPVESAGKVKTGADASADGRSFLLVEYDSDESIDKAIRTGRPRVADSKRGPSPTVRGRIGDEDFAALAHLEKLSGKSQSALVREAIQLLLEKHKKAS